MKIIKHIVTHQKPHLDELLAIWIILVFGRKFFNLVVATLREIVTNETFKPWDQIPDILFVGCAGSPYDEHGKDWADSSAQLVADDLLSDHEYVLLGRLIHIVGQYDRKTTPVKNPLSSVTKALFEAGKTVEEIAAWTATFFDKVYASEQELYEQVDIEVSQLGLIDNVARDYEFNMRFRKAPRIWNQLAFTDCCKFVGDKKWEAVGNWALELKQKRFDEAMKAVRAGSVHEFGSVVGWVKLVVVNSDNDQVSPASRFCRFDICIQKRSTGNIQIYTDLKRGIRLHKVAAYLRQAEMEARGNEEHDLTFKYLMSEGTIPECPNVCVHEKIGGGNVYNGTNSYEGIEPLKVKLPEIVDIVIDALTPRGRVEEVSSKDNSLAMAFETA